MSGSFARLWGAMQLILSWYWLCICGYRKSRRMGL